MRANAAVETLVAGVGAWKAETGNLAVGGGSAPGGPDHLLTMQLADAVGIDPGAVNYIAYDGGGGMLPAIEAGFPQTEIAAASYRYQKEVEAGERTVVGVNRFQSAGQPIELLEIDETTASEQRAKVAALRHKRTNARVQ